MYCPKCGAQNNDTDSFCSKCGSSLDVRQVSADSPPPFNPAPFNPSQFNTPNPSQFNTPNPSQFNTPNPSQYSTPNPPSYNQRPYTPPPYTQPNNYASPGVSYSTTSKVDNHMVLSIISLFLCTPLGIAAIILSAQVNSKLAAGDAAGAAKSASTAKTCALIGLIGGGILLLLSIMANL